MPVAVITNHNDPDRTGANLQETVLSTASVSSGHFGRVAIRPLQGGVYAQPLYLSGVAIPGKGARNVLYVATMHNLVYALDGDDISAPPLWGPVSLAPQIPLPDKAIGGDANYHDIQVEVGVVSTPVISTAHQAIYLVAATKTGGKFEHQLHALDLATGHEKLGGPVPIQATIQNANGQAITFQSQKQLQRVGLLDSNNRIWVAFGAYADVGPYFGWVFAFAADTLQHQGTFVTTPTGNSGGIWQAGQGLSADATGVYFMTGNGTNKPGADLGCAFVQLDPGTVKMKHWFAPTDWVQLTIDDTDLGSGGVLLIPGTDLLVGGGKDGRLFVLRRDALADVADDTRAVDVFQATTPRNQGLPTSSHSGGYHHIHGSPVYWGGPMGRWIYVGGEADNLRAYRFTGSGFDHSPASVSTVTTPAGSMPGAIMSLSADGSSAGTGVLWASFPVVGDANHNLVDGVLYAFDAQDLTKVLWRSLDNAPRDDVGAFPKFCPPTVANGRVYLPSLAGPYEKLTLPEHVVEAPSLVNIGDTLLGVAWTGTDNPHRVNFEHSTDGRTFGSKVTLNETSPNGTAAAFGGGVLYVAWTGLEAARRVNVISSHDFATFANKVTLAETSPFAPALAYGNGRLFLAWTAAGATRSLNVMSSPDGKTFSNKVALPHTSSAGPQLAFANGHLFLLWAGTGAHPGLNVATSTDGITWAPKVALAESSNFPPALAAPNDLYLAWTGRDGARSLNLLSSPSDIHSFGAKQTYAESAVAGPSLVTWHNKTYMGWAGPDAAHSVNVAPITAGQLSAYGMLP